MLLDIVEARALEGFKVYLRFEDGAEGVVDVSHLVRFEGVFAPLRDPGAFSQVSLNRELGTITWPNGADLDPDVLYSAVTGQPLPSLDKKPTSA
jgi:hypothetical protein